MTDHHGLRTEQDSSGWWIASCDCGWEGDFCPGPGEAADDWADHIENEAAAE